MSENGSTPGVQNGESQNPQLKGLKLWFEPRPADPRDNKYFQYGDQRAKDMLTAQYLQDATAWNARHPRRRQIPVNETEEQTAARKQHRFVIASVGDAVFTAVKNLLG